MDGMCNDVRHIVSRMLFDDAFDDVKAELLDVTWDLGDMSSVEYTDYGQLAIMDWNWTTIYYFISKCNKCHENWVIGQRYGDDIISIRCDNCILSDT